MVERSKGHILIGVQDFSICGGAADRGVILVSLYGSTFPYIFPLLHALPVHLLPCHVPIWRKGSER